MSEIELHRKLLGDRARNAALHAALKKVIRPGRTTVADIGAGTGFIAFLARKLGAKHCTLVEYTDALELARKLARANRITGLSFVQAHSREVANPPKADLVISETLGNFALEEGLLETLVDARRYLADGGVLMPCALRQFVAPVTAERLQREIDVWSSVGHGLDFSAARTVALNNMYVKRVQARDLGGSAEQVREWDRIDFRPAAKTPSSLRQAKLDWNGLKSVYGFALWWEADLLPGITLSTSPFCAATHWEQVYLPLLEPVTLRTGDKLELNLSSDTRPSAGLRVAWRTRVLRKGRPVAEQRQDITRGRL